MAAGTILTVISNIPWGQVLDNAPRVFESATRLWESVSNRNGKAVQQVTGGQRPAQSEAELVKDDLRALHENVKTLREHMKESTEVIKELATQNARLVERVELSRKRLLGLAVATGIGYIGLLVLVLYQRL